MLLDVLHHLLRNCVSMSNVRLDIQVSLKKSNSLTSVDISQTTGFNNNDEDKINTKF